MSPIWVILLQIVLIIGIITKEMSMVAFIISTALNLGVLWWVVKDKNMGDS